MRFCDRHYTAYDGVCPDCAAMEAERRGVPWDPRSADSQLARLNRCSIALITGAVIAGEPIAPVELHALGYARLPAAIGDFAELPDGTLSNRETVLFGPLTGMFDQGRIVGSALVDASGTCVVRGMFPPWWLVDGMQMSFAPGALTARLPW